MGRAYEDVYAELMRVQLSCMNEYIHAFHECISATITFTGIHPLTNEKATAVGKEPQMITTPTYYRGTNGNMPSKFMVKLMSKVCTRRGIIVIPKLFAEALDVFKKRQRWTTVDQVQAAYIISGTLDYWNRKSEISKAYEAKYTKVLDIYDNYINLLMQWVSDGSDDRHDGDKEELELAKVVVEMVTKYLPTDKRQSKKIVRRLRDFKDIPGLKQMLREVKQTIQEQEDPEIEWSEIIDSVQMTRHHSEYGELCFRSRYVTGEVFPKFLNFRNANGPITTRITIRFNTRDAMGSKDDVKFVAVASVETKSIVCSYLHGKNKKDDAKFSEVATKVLASSTWSKEVGPNSRHALDFDGLKLHFMLDKGDFVYFAVTTGDYPIRVAHQMINNLQTHFATFTTSALALKKDQRLGNDCVKVLTTIATTYEDRSKVDKISLVKLQVEGVKETMKDSINIALSNGEKLETLEQKSTELSDNAKMFQKGATDLHRQMRLRKLRTMAAIGFSIILAILLLLITMALTHDNVKFIAIARAADKVIIASYAHTKKDKEDAPKYVEMLTKVLRAPTWKQQVTPNSKHTLDCEPNKFHFTLDNDELVYCAITAADYPIRLAFKLIAAVQEEITSKYASKIMTAKDNGLDKDCAKSLSVIATQYDDRTKVDKIAEVMAQVDAVKSTMQENIQVVLSNTEKMETVEQKSNDLSEQAKVFRNTGKSLSRAMYWKNLKMTIAIGLLIVLVIIIALAMLGVFKSSSSSDTKSSSSTPAPTATVTTKPARFLRNLMDGFDATVKDARFVRGIALLKEKRYEEAVVHFEDLLRTMVENENGAPDSLRLAPVYYEYGNALLSFAEATASVFGEGATKGEDAEEENDLEVAWEMLEVARVLLTKHQGESESIDKELARVYMRLGDLGMESELFQQARADYEKSLALQSKILTSTEMDTTPMADLYCCMAITCIYEHAKQPEEANKPAEETKQEEESKTEVPTLSREELELQGLRYYVLAGHVMRDNLYRQAKLCSEACQSFLNTHIPKAQEKGSAKGKAKAKIPTIEAPLSQLKLDYIGAVDGMRKEFVECALKARDVDPTTAEDSSTLLNEAESQLLEYLEIFTEIKEKIDGLRDTCETNAKEAAKAIDSANAVTTIHFGEATTTVGFGTATSAVKRDAPASVVNVVPVAKKRKITPTPTPEGK
ncbi:hypothetical protein THRCLA_07440 [Thraustotheca clavata]|uniref:Uncharacterized protein n=1 Tax=Thraustotheca clavata TaxID=74557 RepID=A0A1V9ZD85_9STRA|nr:hypothetical protein THRCLA_07440 [Thraustotheca clavata]